MSATGPWVKLRTVGERTVILLRARPRRGTMLLAGGLLLGSLGFLWMTLSWLRADLALPSPYLGHRSFALGLDGAAFGAGVAALALSLRFAWRAASGREVLVCDREGLVVRRGLLSAERFRYAHMRRLRAAPEGEVLAGAEQGDPWQCPTGRNVAFDYGPRTVRVGLRLQPPQARQVVEAIRAYAEIPDTPFSFLTPATSAAGAPRGSRVRIEDDGWNLRIIIPARREYLFALLCLAALVVAVAEAVTIIPDLRDQGEPVSNGVFVLILAGVVFFGAARRLLWGLFGAEEISLLPEEAIRVAHTGGLRASSHAFALRFFEGCEASVIPGPPGTPETTLRKGNVRCLFRKGERLGQIRFGLGLQEAEAEALARLLEERIRALRSGTL